MRRSRVMAASCVLFALVLAGCGGDDGAGETVEPLSNTAPPELAGVAEEGQALTVNKGTWEAEEPVRYAYRWQRCDENGRSCKDIPEARGTTYTLREGDVGATIRVVVTAKAGGASRSAATDVSDIVRETPAGNGY